MQQSIKSENIKRWEAQQVAFVMLTFAGDVPVQGGFRSACKILTLVKLTPREPWK